MGITPFPSFLPLALIAAAGFATVSCQARPDGYWTNPNRSQALSNQEYPADSQRCQGLVASDTVGKSEPYKARLFAQCMQAKGYQWVVEPRGRPPLNAEAQRSPLPLEECSKGRLSIDAFGYHKCVPRGAKEGGAFAEETPQAVPPHSPSGGRAEAPTRPLYQASDGRGKDDESCRQYAKESLSSTYGVYSQCMRERGWALIP